MNLAEYHLRRAGSVQCPILDLPVEVLLMIFKYLSANERRTVESVCRSWFEMYNPLCLLNGQVLNCLGVYQLSATYELIDKSVAEILNLKFDTVKFDRNSSFWKKNGSRIRSITFKNCQFCGALGDIIMYCKNLIHLSFIVESRSFSGTKGYFDMSKDLARIVKKGITRKNLDSLECEIGVDVTRDDTLRQLLSLFPQVKILKLWLCFNQSASYFHEPVWNYLMKSTDRIEKLVLHIENCWHYWLPKDVVHRYLECINAMIRLTELSIKLGRPDEQEVIERFLPTKPLKSLVYNRSRIFPSVATFLQELLRSESNLEHLELSINNIKDFIETRHIFQKLISCGLKSCKLSSAGIHLKKNPESFSSYLLVENGPSASPILMDSMNSSSAMDSIEQFFQYFQTFHHLCLYRVSFAEFKSLLKYQTKLKSLILKGICEPYESFDEHTITSYKNAFNHLTDLEHLELTHRAAYVFMRSLSNKSILRNVNYLKISIYYESQWVFEYGSYYLIRTNPVDLLKLADATPVLKALFVENNGYHFEKEDLVQLCAKLKRLRFLRVNFDYNPKPVHEMFSNCPSLRVVRLKRDVYFFDVINKKLKYKKDVDAHYTFAKPRIAGYAVDWIEF